MSSFDTKKHSISSDTPLNEAVEYYMSQLHPNLGSALYIFNRQGDTGNRMVAQLTVRGKPSLDLDVLIWPLYPTPPYTS